MNIGDKLFVKTGSEFSWARLESIDTKTYITPIYTCVVLHGEHVGETIATPRYLDHVKAGGFIDHRLPEVCNQ